MKRMTKLSHYLAMANGLVLVAIILGLVQGVAKAPDTIPVLEMVGAAASTQKFQFVILGMFFFLNLFFAAIWFFDSRAAKN